MRTRTLGEIIQDMIAIYQKNLVPFIIVSFIGSLAAGILTGISQQIIGTGAAGSFSSMMNATTPEEMERAARAMEAAAGQAAAGLGLAMVFGMLTGAIQTVNGAALVVAAGQAIQGQAVDAAGAWTAVLGKAIVLVVVSLVVGILVGIGVVLFITIPVVIYLAVRWGFFAQAYLIENREPMASFSRSTELVKGQWWRVLGIIIVVGIVTFIINAVLGIVLGIVLGMIPVIGVILATTVIGAVTGPLFPIAHTLLYYDLRARKEAPPAAPMAPRRLRPSKANAW